MLIVHDEIILFCCCILLSIVSRYAFTSEEDKKRCRHPSHAFTQAASEWKPDPTYIEDYAYTVWWRHQLFLRRVRHSPISENTNHHFGRSYFLTSFRGFSGERKIIVNALYVYCICLYVVLLLRYIILMVMRLLSNEVVLTSQPFSWDKDTYFY